MTLTVPYKFEAGAARAGERQLDHPRMSYDRQVRVPHHRPQEGARRAAAHSALDVEVHGADALGRGDVQVVEIRHPAGPTRADERGRHRVKAARARRGLAPRRRGTRWARPPSPPTS